MALPIVIGEAGAQPTSPEDILTNYVNRLNDVYPEFTLLPPDLVSGFVQTATIGLSEIDQTGVDLINSVSPYSVNIPLVREYGYLYGITQVVSQNVQVFLTFTGTPNAPIGKGFLVSNGNYQFSVQNNVRIPSTGTLTNVLALGVSAGNYPVPENTITQIITSIPSNITLTVNNPNPGIPPTDPESIDDYRERVLLSGQRTVQGGPDFIKSTISNVPGVSPNLVAVRNPAPGQFAVVVEGGDDISVANAIYESIPDVSSLTADVTNVSGQAINSVTINIISPPDTYPVTFIRPSVQTVTLAVTYKTITAVAVSVDTVSALVSEPIADYINNLMIGAPINLLLISDIFINSVASVIPGDEISFLGFEATINGTVVPPETGTDIIVRDLYGYFNILTNAITVNQG